MTNINDDLHYDENTEKKVYEALLESGIFGQQALDVVKALKNKGILFREAKPKRRGRPPKPVVEESSEEKPVSEPVEDAWAPKPA
jgi:hypothetical protein